MTPNELNAALGRLAAPDTGFEGFPDYCGDLNAVVQALNALGLKRSMTQERRGSVATVWRDNSMLDSFQAHVDGETPGALATALVRAALGVLGEEVRDGEGDRSCDPE